jgi:hypothetical protein
MNITYRLQSDIICAFFIPLVPMLHSSSGLRENLVQTLCMVMNRGMLSLIRLPCLSLSLSFGEGRGVDVSEL